MIQQVDLRVLQPGDERILLDLMDDAVSWLNRRGITRQWGTEPFSADPRRVATVRGWLESSHCLAATHTGLTAGALVLGTAPDYVPPPGTPEVYVNLLVSAHLPELAGVGRWLLAHADHVARERGVDRLRVDCYAGDGSPLPRFYESCGYERTTTFSLGTWDGVVLTREIHSRPTTPTTEGTK